ncbi:hypothetical protein [Gracilimonas sp.]|uniref:hypothetical protein n=1 Tax=Gracilimonas sp. TaxID=1974203 RepID=UPI003BA9A925
MKMKYVAIALFFLIPGQLAAQSFAPEISLKTGINRISSAPHNPDYEQQHTLMIEVEALHPVFYFERSVLSLGINSSLRREAENLKTYSCLDCPQFNFEGYAMGTHIKLQTVNTSVLFGIYSGLNLNQIIIDQTRFGLQPTYIQTTPHIKIKESYLNLASGLRGDVPIYKNLFFTGDFRFYFPLDDSDFNQRRTALSVGLNLRF